MKLDSLLPTEAVLPLILAKDKKQVLKKLAAVASEQTGLSEREIYSVLAEREQLGCTGMGGGVCIPHGRFAKLGQVRGFFARLEKPVEFGAADGKPVDIVFMLLSPIAGNTEHIKALAVISRIMRDKEMIQQLRAAPDEAALYSLLTSGAREEA